MTQTTTELSIQNDHLCGRFSAMASPCEILFDCTDIVLVRPQFLAAIAETKRIEEKYSRYINDNPLYIVNHSNGKPVAIDDETFQLLNFADTCYQISEGMFDITSGVFRKVWKFNGSDNIPPASKVSALLPFIGWQKISYTESQITVPKGFELDFGGIGKEYAVNKVSQLLAEALPSISMLINFGGDIQVTSPRKKAPHWQVGIENPTSQKGVAIVNIAKGGLATSGDANRYLMKNGKRYSHILNPKTGFPIEDGPRSITVAGDYCVQAGLLATLALLQGKNAEAFLKQQNVEYWCYK
ncbi:FAD:protein FMN transferase [uncultured Paraglaciecola sp.]|uniref:FAD:protein FMN transferase n=1 Tax=uncultured Paraglaciecola sp. TaxID=1765024 RepID=UPI0025915578|nr:FAD:protein FMN transferase [uncultured Paraglaciecola sp.]